MAMTLITGLPGSGKTLEVVRIMRDDYKDRKKYAANFPNLSYDFLDVEEFNPMEWAKCEPGSVLFIDEAWEYFEARGPHKLPSDVIREFARHRHYGLDIFLVCQGPFQLDSHVRALIENHLHVIRPFGMKYSIIRKFRGVSPFPGDRQAMRDTVDVATKRVFDKKLFPLYKSAEVHTVKRKIPFKMIGSIVAILAAVGAIWNMLDWGQGFYSKTREGAEVVVASEAVPELGPGPSFGRGGGDVVLPLLGTAEFSAEKFKQSSSYFMGESLAVDGAPWTALKYRQVESVVAVPRPYCILAAAINRCVCLSQQGTRLETNYEVCARVARDGLFDVSLPDRDHQPGDSMYPDKGGPAGRRASVVVSNRTR